MIIRPVPGFMIVELLIAMLIMAIMAFVGMGYYTKTVIIQKDTELYLQATTVASSALEKLLSEQIIPTQNQQQEGPFTIDFVYQHADNFVTVDATVHWQSVSKTPRQLTLSSGFVPKVQT